MRPSRHPTLALGVTGPDLGPTWDSPSTREELRLVIHDYCSQTLLGGILLLQLGNLLSFFDHTKGIMSTTDRRTKTIPTDGLSLLMTRGEELVKTVVISSEKLLFLGHTKTNKETNKETD